MNLEEVQRWLLEQWQSVLEEPDTGADLSADMLITSNLKTPRYVVLSQLLGKIADPQRDILTLQKIDPHSRGPWDARSFAHKVIVPWEQGEGTNFLGGSPSPYINNAARVPRLIRDRTDARGPDQWRRVYDFLSPLEDCTQEARIHEFRRLLRAARRSLELMMNIRYPVPARISIRGLHQLIKGFLTGSTKAERSLVVAAALFETLGSAFSLFTKVAVQGIYESDSVTGALGDITCLDDEDRPLIVVEVKSQELTLQDVHSSIIKVKEQSESRSFSLIFVASSLRQGERAEIEQKIMDEYTLGMNVYTISILGLVDTAFVLLEELHRIAFIRRIGKRLDSTNDYTQRQAWRDLLTDDITTG